MSALPNPANNAALVAGLLNAVDLVVVELHNAGVLRRLRLRTCRASMIR
jgi:hypothetical protein